MTDDSASFHNTVAVCPECDDIIGLDHDFRCAVCARLFHMECLDPDTLCCLECAMEADIIDKTPGSGTPPHS